MPTRVLTTIKEQNKLIGFRIISTKSGMTVVNLQKAEELYQVEPFENVELKGHSWRGLECSLDKLPVQDRMGNYLVRNAEIIVLRKKIDENDKTVGFEFMNLDGQITPHNVPEALRLAEKYKLINAEVVDGKYIRSSRGALKVKKVKPDTQKGVYIGLSQPIVPPIIQNMPSKDTVSVPNVMVAASTEVQKPVNTVKGNNSQMKDEKLRKQKELTDLLDKAATAYYLEDREIMSNYDYDKKEKELEALEAETGVIFANSVTQSVGGSNHFEKVSKLSKIKHASPMLSLDKTKDRDALGNILGSELGFLGWKLDGLTVVLTYENGELLSSVTRGTGTVGEDITHNACAFTNVPKKISYKDRLVLRGEAMITYEMFNKINSKITVEADKYKNPRNLASGSVRQIDSKVAKSRKPVFVVFEVKEGFDEINSKSGRMYEVEKLGFEIVEFVMVRKAEVVDAIAEFEKKVDKIPYPTDGLVLGIDDIKYGELLGMTGKFPRHSKAFKWKDEEKETQLVDIDWSCSRTGAINPVAVFKPTELEGTTVTRASLSNVSIFESFELGVGDTLTVFKANMIIPQVAENLTRSNTCKLPSTCPVCGGAVKLEVSKDGTKTLYCTNPDCSAKKVGSLAHFVKREALNIDGIGESTLDDLMSEGIVKTYKDLYHLDDKKDAILALDGYAIGAYKKMLAAVEASRETELPNFIYGFGIEQLGRTTSKDICKAFDYDFDRVITATEDDLRAIPGVGDATIKAYMDFFGNPKNVEMIKDVAKEVTFKAPKVVNVTQSVFTGKLILASGTLSKYTRNEIKAKIEELGGKPASGVSKKVDYALIGTGVSKIDKVHEANAQGANIQIISEDDFLNMIGEA